MCAGLHGFIIPEFKASLDMMKFALNHPNRFHNWKKAFSCGFFRAFMLTIIEIDNSFRICGRCNLILVVIGYISFTALMDVDAYLFGELSPDLPFKKVVDSTGNYPYVLNWDKTSSDKNSWSD
jgi:hypothetical protein